MKHGKKLLSAILSLTMVASSLIMGIGFGGVNVKAAGTAPDGNYTETSCLAGATNVVSTASGCYKEDGSYEGYITTMQKSAILESDYLKVEFTVGK